jgi:hypothetical protein
MSASSIEQQKRTALYTIEGRDRLVQLFDDPMAFEVETQLYGSPSAAGYR